MNDDFYIVMPSNSCPTVHPDNHASKFHVTFSEMIQLRDSHKWAVALTEVDYNFIFLTLDRGHGIKYVANGNFELSVDFNMHYDINGQGPNGFSMNFPQNFAPSPRYGDIDTYEPLQYSFVEGSKKLVFYNNKRFKMHIGNVKDAALMGMRQGIYESKYHEYWGHCVHFESSFIFNEQSFSVPVTVTFYTGPFEVIKEVSFSKSKRFTTADQLLKHLSKYMKGVIFEEVSINYKGRLELKPYPEIQQLEFLNDLNTILGFLEIKVSLPGDSHPIRATYPPQLNRGIKNLLIYTSVAAPIHVGDIRAPLLKHISLPTQIETNELAGYRHITVYNPMYVPVSQAFINSIEVNIRSDSGHLIPFIPGSITTLVLHFKKTW